MCDSYVFKSGKSNGIDQPVPSYANAFVCNSVKTVPFKNYWKNLRIGKQNAKIILHFKFDDEHRNL